MDIHFNCTQCGKCCQDLKLPLTVSEAIQWLENGHAVQVICDAMPGPQETAADDSRATHRRRRSFSTKSGSLTSNVVVILAANLAGRCPNLGADMKCGLYESRPLVCRIYPAEINPFIQLDPRRKACPPEAWTADQPVIQRGGRITDACIRENIEQSRETDRRNVGIKQRVCAALNIHSAAVADEGFVVHSPDAAALLAELTRAVDNPAGEIPDAQWHFVSNRAESVDSLASQGALASLAGDGEKQHYEYLGFR
jgi:Fe-S-cluster containining protein